MLENIWNEMAARCGLAQSSSSGLAGQGCIGRAAPSTARLCAFRGLHDRHLKVPIQEFLKKLGRSVVCAWDRWKTHLHEIYRSFLKHSVPTASVQVLHLDGGDLEVSTSRIY